ncbi:MAG: NTP transferase domain-containing protein [Candidatus Colwellbacteria bacterium]|nr:NTP transferase domain-containing protein [Candidatus Colwellbacteria bacterium]
MNCIILAGGLGTRLRPLTYTTPKTLLEIKGKPILQYTLEALPDEIKTVVIAVKHLGQKIKARFGKKFGKKKIIYVDLISLRGTMDALKQCKKYVKGVTLVLNGDDIYGKEDLTRLVKASNPRTNDEVASQFNEIASSLVWGSKKEPRNWFMLVKETMEKTNAAKVILASEGTVKDIIESPLPQTVYGKENSTRTDLVEKAFVNTGAYILDERIFRYKPARLASGEFGLPQTMMQAKKDISIIALKASSWMPMNTEEDYEKAKKSTLQRG